MSGLSPFGGETDEETLRNVKASDWAFDADAFARASDECKDFIRKLLIKDPMWVYLFGTLVYFFNPQVAYDRTRVS
jgi:hypothetical protein